MELDDGHGDGSDEVDIQVLQLEKEEREKQNGLKAKVFFNSAILFCHSRDL